MEGTIALTLEPSWPRLQSYIEFTVLAPNFVFLFPIPAGQKMGATSTCFSVELIFIASG